MTIASGTPISKPNGQIPFVDLTNGNLSSHGVQLLTAWYNFIVGMNRITPCAASGANLITLTPLTASPLIEGYVDYEVYSFTAASNSTSSVTMTVVPRNGALSTLKAYKTNGSAQAGNGDIVSGSHYLAIYVSTLDSGSGGFVIK